MAQRKPAAGQDSPSPQLPFRLHDRYSDPFSNYTPRSPFLHQDPKSLSLDLKLDTTMRYTVYERINGIDFRPPIAMNFSEFDAQQTRLLKKQYWREQSRLLDEGDPTKSRGLIPKIYVGPILDRIFGGSYIELIPRGFVTLDLGGSFQRIENPSIPIRQQRTGGFEFDQQISLNLLAKVGEKLTLTTNFDNNNSFDFQNNIKVEYTGFKEEVIRKLEIGNVSLPTNSSLIRGAQNLFGFKAQFQFGKLSVTALAATQRGKQATLQTDAGGDQGRKFEVVGSNYEENQYFFLGQFFRDRYEEWMGTLPQLTSGVNITRVEVYVLNRQNNTQTLRNVVGLMDVGESDKIYRKDLLVAPMANSPTSNGANNLFDLLSTVSANAAGINNALTGLGLTNGSDFEKITAARKLTDTEYTVHKELGYIVLQRRLQNDEALAVSFEYTYNGVRYKVGELTEDYISKPAENVIYLKLLRPRKISIRDDMGAIIPTWNLMMKNVYSLGATKVAREGFQLRIIYRDDRTGIDNPQIQDGVVSRTIPLIQALGLDRLNPYNDPQPDGDFDFVEHATVNSEVGVVIFPFLEPFNGALRKLFERETDQAMRDFLLGKYLYDTLYHTTKVEAEQITVKNKFYIVGASQSGTGKEIMIPGFNVTKGSVTVYAGDLLLVEGTDYTVDYTFGKVTVLNEGILSSGKQIRVTYEQQDPFSFQTRTLVGARLDYRLGKDINLGSTLLYYNEQPLLSRNIIGSEPSRNFKYGFDFNIAKDSRFLTKMVDALPFLQTKERSTINFSAEFAQLLPGTSNILNGDGTSFIDDFENTATPYLLLSPRRWRLSSIPRTASNSLDPSGGALNDVSAGYRRAKLAWYQIDNQFYVEGVSSFKPSNISAEDLRNHYVRPVQPSEIFPYFDAYIGNFNEAIMNLAYYPSERGPYNFNPDLNPDGTLKNPVANWGGVTTAIRTEVDFDKANIEYLEFWLLDPFINSNLGRVVDSNGSGESNITGGQVVFNLGSISEDVMHDAQHAFENGLPSDGNLINGPVMENSWGYVTTQQYLNDAFDNSSSSRANQDVGLDGVGGQKEEEKFQGFIASVPAAAAQAVQQDPAADNFQHFLDDGFNSRDAKVLERYKNFNGLERNSPILSGNDPFTRSGSTIPDNEDINQDNTLSDLEEYYSYTLNLTPATLRVGQKYVVDQVTNQINGDQVSWYLIRIPVRQFDEKVGEINGFKSVRYARMYLTGFVQPVVLRLAKFRLIGSQWRRYLGNLKEAKPSETPADELNNFSVSVVNAEENGRGNTVKPPYIPPLQRDRDITSTVERRLNEQAIQLCVTNLADGDSRAMFKNVSMDFFNYGRIKMFFSAYGANLEDDQLHAFIRLGTDQESNYYEIEIPLKATLPSANLLDQVWPEANQIDIDLNEVYALKAQRDREGFPLYEDFPQAGPKAVGRHLIRIHGRPDMSQVKSIMIGVRNPASAAAKAYDVCLWSNELRLTDFDRTAGWAATASFSAKLADLGSVNGSVRHTAFGYGEVHSKISERERSATTAFDISANLELGKLLPQKAGLKIPMFVGLETTIIDPNYDPANPDLRIQAALKSFSNAAEQSSYLQLIQDRSVRRSLNFTNVRKVKVKPNAKKHIYDIENFSFTYAYSELTRSNFSIAESVQRSIKGVAAWQYASSFKGFEPFKNIKALSSPYLQLIRDFNINPVPSFMSARATLDRSFNKIVYRNAIADTAPQVTNYRKYFTFNRAYVLQWNISKGLGLNYDATANTIIDEPDGDIDTKEKKDVVLENLKKFGRMKRFEQNVAINYKIPFDKFPLTSWLHGEYRYSVGYTWTAGPRETVDSLRLGNIIQNNRAQAFTGKIDLVSLYNKIPALKKVNTPRSAISKSDTTAGPSGFLRGFARLLMSIRSFNLSYNLTDGTTLPGFSPSPFLFGLDETFSAPGWKFVFGDQNIGFRLTARDNNWLTRSERLTTPYTQTRSEDLNIQAAIEPFNDFQIQLNAQRVSSTHFQEIFRFDAGRDEFVSLGPSRGGSYKVSTLSVATAFANNTSINSSVFETFKSNLEAVRTRFASLTSAEYKAKSQDVLIPAFISAYTGSGVDGVGLSPFPKIPIPGWSINYTGLQKVPALQKIFQSISLNHAYTSTYSVVNYTSSLDYANVELATSPDKYNDTFFASALNASGEPIPTYVISQVMISEAFAPLIGLAFTTKNRISFRFDYRTKRDVALNVSNAQITEVNSQDWAIEAGYTKQNIKLPWRKKGKIVTLKNDVTFRINASLANTTTIQRKIDEVNAITGGNINLRLRPSINYVFDKKLSAQLYVDYNANDPLVTNSYPRSTTRVGLKILFNLSD